MSKLWKVLGEEEPTTANTDRRLQFAKAFERLLITATAGAFFFALARNVPVHAKEFSCQPDWAYTFDRILRYLCLT